jgi:hypothetical protein
MMVCIAPMPAPGPAVTAPETTGHDGGPASVLPPLELLEVPLPELVPPEPPLVLELVPPLVELVPPLLLLPPLPVLPLPLVPLALLPEPLPLVPLELVVPLEPLPEEPELPFMSLPLDDPQSTTTQPTPNARSAAAYFELDRDMTLSLRGGANRKLRVGLRPVPGISPIE